MVLVIYQAHILVDRSARRPRRIRVGRPVVVAAVEVVVEHRRSGNVAVGIEALAVDSSLELVVERTMAAVR